MVGPDVDRPGRWQVDLGEATVVSGEGSGISPNDSLICLKNYRGGSQIYWVSKVKDLEDN